MLSLFKCQPTWQPIWPLKWAPGFFSDKYIFRTFQITVVCVWISLFTSCSPAFSAHNLSTTFCLLHSSLHLLHQVCLLSCFSQFLSLDLQLSVLVCLCLSSPWLQYSFSFSKPHPLFFMLSWFSTSLPLFFILACFWPSRPTHRNETAASCATYWQLARSSSLYGTGRNEQTVCAAARWDHSLIAAVYVSTI